MSASARTHRRPAPRRVTTQRVELDDLIEDDRVHGSLYANPEIFDAELDRIWHDGWVFVGHASEVPRPGDRAARSIGPWPVVLARRHDGGLAVDGAARCDSMHGFVFASLAHHGIELDEHLGDAAGALDRLARLSPAGEVELNRGWLKHGVEANWKMLLENETDGYHPNFVQNSIFSVAKGPLAGLFDQGSSAQARELGGGDTELVLTPQFRRAGPLSWVGSSPDRMPVYRERMRDVYGEAADQIITDGRPSPRDDLPQPVHRRAQPQAVPQHARVRRPCRAVAGRRRRDVRAQPARRAVTGPGMADTQAGPWS
jgi:fatty-acyl-CoA synthase